jgi:hypothetical protein
VRALSYWLLLCTVLTPWAVAQAASPPAAGDTVILADPRDPYYSLAEEMAEREKVPLVRSLEEALDQEPTFLLWVVSPARLSDQVLIDYSRATRDRPSAISMGIISGATLADARDLWLRAHQVQGERVISVNAANPAGHIEAGIRTFGENGAVAQPLTKEALLYSLSQADYLTYTGHGGRSTLWLDDETALKGAELPSLPPAVITTGSCNTFRPWEEDSIALAVTDRGAAAYAGFAYSPNEGYLIGEFDGVPMRYTWPGFPIGHVVQVQNHGTLQGFAQFPYYFLLGDPRIALQAEASYRVVEDQVSGDMRVYSIAEAPAGLIPVRIPGGARYHFANVPGVGAAWEHDPFYNARLQMVNIEADKFLLVEHKGQELTVQLRSRPPWYWVPYDILTDALDTTLLFLTNGGGDVILLVAGVLAWVPVVWRQRRRKVPTRIIGVAALTGLGFAALHGVYALTHLSRLSITSKVVEFSPLSVVDTFLLVGSGAFLFLTSRSCWGRATAVLVPSLGALAPAIYILATIGVVDYLLVGPQLGVGLYNFSLVLQPLIALVLESILFGTLFCVLYSRFGIKEVVQT